MYKRQVRGYSAPLKEAGVDTLILGCTHYPLIAPAIQRILGRDVRLVTAGHAIAGAIQRQLAATGSLSTGEEEGAVSYTHLDVYKRQVWRGVKAEKTHVGQRHLGLRR